VQCNFTSKISSINSLPFTALQESLVMIEASWDWGYVAQYNFCDIELKTTPKTPFKLFIILLFIATDSVCLFRN